MRRYWPYIVGALLIGLIAWFAVGLARSGDQDRLDDDQINGGNTAGQEARTAGAQDRCATQGTYDLLKRELFRQAAQVRGNDAAVFDRLSAYAALRVEAPVMDQQDAGLGMVSCSARASLDLPPGVAVVGGRRTLTTNLSYAVQPAADGSGDVLTLRGADAIIIPLATLAREGTRPGPASERPAASEPDAGLDAAQAEPQAGSGATLPLPRPAPPSVEPGPTARAPVAERTARPSFDCARARTRSEIAVCSDAGLAALDREMASFYTRSYRSADAQTRDLLERTRSRFLAYRDRCTSNACVADAYRGRITEIRDIVDGQWAGGR